MYDILNQIIDHAWISNYSGEQQYVMNMCCALIPILTVVFIDTIKSVFSSFLRK